MTSLGVVFRPQFPPEQLRVTAEAADRAGVDELWLWEDCFLESGIATASAALGWTERLTVGVGILPVPLRNPALTAMEVATLARLFPGRVRIGLGHGIQEWMGQVGARVASPMTLLREYLSAVQRLLAGEAVTVEGRYVRLDDVRLGWPADPPPPIVLGAGKPKTIALAGELADGLVVSDSTTVDDLRAARAIYDQARGERPGRVTNFLTAVTGTDAAARFAAEVGRRAAAGADAVILQPAGDDDPVEYARFAGEQVRPLLG